MDFAAGVRMLRHFFMPDSVKARDALAASYSSSGLDASLLAARALDAAYGAGETPQWILRALRWTPTAPHRL